MDDTTNQNKEEVEETSIETESTDSKSTEDIIYHEDVEDIEAAEESEVNDSLLTEEDTDSTESEEFENSNDVSGNDPGGNGDVNEQILSEVTLYDTYDYTSHFENLEILSILQLGVLIALGVAICFCKGFDKKWVKY